VFGVLASGWIHRTGCLQVVICGALYTEGWHRPGLRARLPVDIGARPWPALRRRRRGADQAPGGGPAGVRLDGHRRARPGARAPASAPPRRAACPAGNCWLRCGSFAWLNLVGADIVEVAPAPITPRLPASR